MLLALTLHALANEGPGDTQGDFRTGTRSDAPTDALLLFEATFDLDATVLEGPGAPFTLRSRPLVGAEKSRPTVTFAPDAGWEAGAAYVVEVGIQGWDEDELPAELAFTAGTDLAASPTPPAVTSAAAGDWTEEEDIYPSGCCAFTRNVAFEVEASADDPWAYVELIGLVEGEPWRVDIAVGPGTHTLHYLQWKQDGVIEPAAFEVAQVSASGERSEAERFEFPRSGGEGAVSPPGVCGTPGAVALGPLALALLLVRRRAAVRAR